MKNNELEYKISYLIPGVGIKYFFRVNKFLESINDEDMPSGIGARFVVMSMYQTFITPIIILNGIILEKLLH